MNEKNYHVSKRKATAGALVLTGFAALSSQFGLVSHLAKSLEAYAVPSAMAKTINTASITIHDEKLSQELKATTLILEGSLAYIVNLDGEKSAAPSGYYKLSNNQLLTVQDGRVMNKVTLKSDEQIANFQPEEPWLDGWERGPTFGRHWVQAAVPSPNQGGEVSIRTEQTTANVRDTLNKIS